MYILSIDVGLINLALVYAEVDENFDIVTIMSCHKIDLTKYYECCDPE